MQLIYYAILLSDIWIYIYIYIYIYTYTYTTIPGGSEGEESTYNARDPGSIPGLERSPGGGNGNLF